MRAAARRALVPVRPIPQAARATWARATGLHGSLFLGAADPHAEPVLALIRAALARGFEARPHPDHGDYSLIGGLCVLSDWLARAMEGR